MDCTIDTETLGTYFDSVILSVGAVKFDPKGEQEPHSPFYLKLDTDFQIEQLGRTVNESTMEWWAKQDHSLIDETFSDDDRVYPIEFIKEFNRYVVGCDNYWAQGAVFDFAILEHLYKNMGIPFPINYWACRDSRTLFKLMPSDPRHKMNDNAHNALSDAYYQSIAIQKCYAHFGLSV